MIELEAVSWSYAETDRAALTDVNLSVTEGEFVVLCGRSGCGKSTLLKLVNGVVPNHEEGDLSGRVSVAGIEPTEIGLQELSATVASVFQHPRSQLFTLNTTDELLFGCSNHRVPGPEMVERLQDTAGAFRLSDLLDRSIFELSGGEAQKIACAAAHMIRPSVVVLDEPSASLDGDAIATLTSVLAALKQSGTTILVAEHRLYYLMDLCDRVAYLDDGRLHATYDRDEFLALNDRERSTMGLRTLTKPRIELVSESPADVATPDADREPAEQGSVVIERLRCKRRRELAVDITDLVLPKGQVIAVTGPNGAGKSTLAAGFSGVLRGDAVVRDEVELSRRERLRRSFVVLQDVHHQLFAESVLDEVLLGQDFNDEARQAEAATVLESLDLDAFADIHPYRLSGGQKQRVAIAAALLAGKRYLIFDEPTSGIDRGHMERFGRRVQAIKHQVDLVVVITHDAEFITTCADQLIELDRGRVTETTR